MATSTITPAYSAILLDRKARSLEVLLAAALMLIIATIFWTEQRYPALLKKLHSGDQIKVAGALSFDALLRVNPAAPLPERVGRTGVNWLYTNRFGMYFALPFGAAVMTLMANAPGARRFRSAGANVFCGAVAGAPMGVCTNCATPVAQSLLAGGASTRLTLAAMISSPSFNPIVVAMAFVLFPLRLAALRVAVPAVLLLVLPLLVRENAPTARGILLPEAVPNLRERLVGFFVAYGRNLLRLLWMTLPWMLLAAFLGALAVQLIPAYGTHLAVSVLGIVAVAALGTFLPLPMALDVALSYVLYRAGVPLPYVAALLCTLGPVSIYSLSAMSRQIGRAASLRLAGTVLLLGTAAGLLVRF